MSLEWKKDKLGKRIIAVKTTKTKFKASSSKGHVSLERQSLLHCFWNKKKNETHVFEGKSSSNRVLSARYFSFCLSSRVLSAKYFSFCLSSHRILFLSMMSSCHSLVFDPSSPVFILLLVFSISSSKVSDITVLSLFIRSKEGYTRLETHGWWRVLCRFFLLRGDILPLFVLNSFSLWRPVFCFSLLSFSLSFCLALVPNDLTVILGRGRK